MKKLATKKGHRLWLVGVCLAVASLASSAVAQTTTWTRSGNGSWQMGSNWSSGAPNAANVTAILGNSITANSTITLQNNRRVGNITNTSTAFDYTISGSRTLTLDVTSGAPTINVVNSDRMLTIAAILGGNDGMTKTGSGTLRLTGVNTYTGATTVSEGTLLLDGFGSINSSLPIIVAPGATLIKSSAVPLDVAPVLNGTGPGPNERAILRGNGRINAAMTLDSIYNVVAPGESPGTLSFGESQSWNSYTYAWEVNDWTAKAPSTNFDLINITGGLTLTGNASGSYVLNVLSLTGANDPGSIANFAETNNAWTILTASSGITGFNADFWTISTGGFTNADLGTWSLSLANSDRDLVLTYTAVPEPPMIALAAAAGIAGLVIRRRRRQA